MSSTTRKSKNFDRNLNSRASIMKLNKNLYKIGSTINTTAKQKYVPIDTRATINSCRVEVGDKQVKLSSLDWRINSTTRYYYTSSSVAKNRDKHHWFNRGYEDNKNNIEKIAKDIYE